MVSETKKPVSNTAGVCPQKPGWFTPCIDSQIPIPFRSDIVFDIGRNRISWNAVHIVHCDSESIPFCHGNSWWRIRFQPCGVFLAGMDLARPPILVLIGESQCEIHGPHIIAETLSDPDCTGMM